jgi:hypothetical protein
MEAITRAIITPRLHERDCAPLLSVLGGSIQLPALPTEAFELWFLRHRRVATLLADKPTFRATQHRPELIIQSARRTANKLV